MRESVVILVTPRDPAFIDKQRQQAIEEFVARRKAFLKAAQGSKEDLQRFREEYPDWYELAPNRYASHFFLMNQSDLYRKIRGDDLSTEALEFDLLNKK